MIDRNEFIEEQLLRENIRKAIKIIREKKEKQAINELKLGKKSAVTDMNREIYTFDLNIAEAIDEEIDAEENNLANLVDDDDYGDLDGDEF